MRNCLVNIPVVLFVSAFLTACGNDSQDQQITDDTVTEQATLDSGESAGESAGGSVARGESLYKRPTLSGAPGCITCHSLNPGTRLIGPSLANAATAAAEAVDGMSAEEYLRESITDPDAHITPGFSKGLMYQRYGRDLTPQQIDDLVAFLLTLE